MKTKFHHNSLFVILIAFLFLFQNCQENEIIGTEQLDTNLIETSLKGTSKILICHFAKSDNTWELINVTEKSLEKHLGHGDVQLMDSDGDGYYSSESNCFTEYDCDDTNPNIYPGSVETCDEGTFIDERDGREYKWVKIGNQIWMAENLSYLANREGVDEIWNAIEDNYEYNREIYGVYYNWLAAKEESPEGWHLPTIEEWDELASFINSDQGGTYWTQDMAWGYVGRHLQSPEHWDTPYGLDTYGFSALPGLGNHIEANFGSNCFFWTASDISEVKGIAIVMQNMDENLYIEHFDKNYFITARYVKDL